MKNLKRLSLLIVALLFTSALEVDAKSNKLLLGGSGWKQVAIYDRDKEAVVQSFELPDGSECNSVVKGYGNTIVFTYKTGVKAVTLDGETVFDIQKDGKEEFQSVSKIKGGYLVGVCSTPGPRILELDRKGNIVKEIRYDIGIPNPHAQHRQIAKTAEGTYLIPARSSKNIVEIDGEGNILRKVTLKGNLFGVEILKSGNWLVGCGDLGCFLEVDPVTEEIVREVNSETLGGDIKLGFVAELIRLKNGHTILCNWLGHSKNKSEPLLLELDENYNIVWRINAGTEGIDDISAAYIL